MSLCILSTSLLSSVVRNPSANLLYNSNELNQNEIISFIQQQQIPSFSGVLACLDGYMNIALDQTEEYANGQLKNKYGDAFIRGNNVLYISTQKRRV